MMSITPAVANQSRSIIILNRRVGYMSLCCHPRRGRLGTIWVQTILAPAVLFTLLVARNAPPVFSQAPSLHHSAISAGANQNHRPHFESDGLQWGVVVAGFLPFPPPADSAHLVPTSHLSSTLQTKGFHYNRPPPAS